MSELLFGVLLVSKVDTNWHVLLALHKSGNYWSLPKGHAELGETPTETALRECKEETGITDVTFLPHTEFIEQYTLANPTPHTHTVTYFLAETSETQLIPQAAEISECRWLPLDEAIELATYPSTKEHIQKAASYLATL